MPHERFVYFKVLVCFEEQGTGRGITEKVRVPCWNLEGESKMKGPHEIARALITEHVCLKLYEGVTAEDISLSAGGNVHPVGTCSDEIWSVTVSFGKDGDTSVTARDNHGSLIGKPTNS